MKKELSSEKWVMLFPIFLFLFYDFVQINIMNTFNPFLIKMVSITPTMLGLISSLLLYVNLFLLIPAGLLLDNYKPSKLVALSIIPTILGSLIAASNISISSLVIWRILSGFTGAFSYLSCVKMISMHFSRKRVGFLIGVSGFPIMLAGIFAQTPLLYLISHFGIQGTLIINAIAGLLVAIVMFFTIDTKPEIDTLHLAEKIIHTPYRSLLNWLIALFASLANLPLFVLGAVWSSLYLLHAHDINLHHAAAITAMVYTGNLIGGPIVGFISDRSNNRIPGMIILAILFFVIILLITQISTIWLLYILYFILGIATNAQTLAYSSIVDFNKDTHVAKATSLVSLLTVGLGALAQSLFGALVDIGKQPHYQYGIILLLVAAVVAFIISLYLKRLRNNHIITQKRTL